MGLHFSMLPSICNTQQAYKRNYIYLFVVVFILVLKSRQPLMARLATADRCSLPSNKVMITNNEATESQAWQRKGHGPGGHVIEERWRCDGRPATVHRSSSSWKSHNDPSVVDNMPLNWLPHTDEIMCTAALKEKQLPTIILYYYDCFLCVCYNGNFQIFLPGIWKTQKIAIIRKHHAIMRINL